MRKLCVIAQPGYQVCNFDLMDAGVRRFLEPGVPVEVNHRREWIDEIRAGVCAAGDEQTAKLAGVAWKKAGK